MNILQNLRAFVGLSEEGEGGMTSEALQECLTSQPPVIQPVVEEVVQEPAPVAATPTPAPAPVVEEEVTADSIIIEATKNRLEIARQKKAAAKAADSQSAAIDKMVEHTQELQKSFRLADSELVNSMKAEANALAKLDMKVAERLAQEDEVLAMIEASNQRMAALAGGDLFAEEHKSNAWGQTTKATAKAEDVWGDCKVYKAPNLAVEADWGPEVVEAETHIRFENAFNDVWEEVEAES